MCDSTAIRAALENDGAINLLAAVEHERWAHWQQYLHDQCERLDDGSLLIPSGLVSRWEDQIRKPYVEMSPEEQESDRQQVRRYLPTVVQVLTD